MNFVYKIPGPLLILTGGFCLSWGGLILRTFESASIWQILFYRSIFFLWVLIAFILLTYRKKTFKKNEFFYDYLKKEPKQGRKMGHLTILKD